MKKLLLAGLLLSGFTGCSKKEDAMPVAPTLVGGTWTLNIETIVTTNKTTGAVTTQRKPFQGTTFLTSYTADGQYKTLVYTPTAPVATAITGTYTYSGGTLTWNENGNGKSSSAGVTVLDLSNLTLVTNSEDATNRYQTTDTYTR